MTGARAGRWGSAAAAGGEAAAAGERLGAPLAIAIFLCALVLRVATALEYESGHPHAEQPVIDEQAYDAWARRIAAGDWVGEGVFFQEPLYPYALGAAYAVLGPDRTPARIAQCALGALTAVLGGALGARLFGRRAGAVAGFALAVYRPALWFPALLLKENLFLPVLAALALALVRARTARGWLGAGALVGLGALLRGNLLAMAPAIVLWPLARGWLARGARRGSWKALALHGAACAAGIALVLLPVALRNRAVGGVLVLTTSGAGTNLYGGNNAANPYGRATEFDWVRGIPEHEEGDWRREAERRLGRELDPSAVSAYWSGEVLESVRRDPALHVSILWNKLRLTLGSYEVPDNHLLDWDARYVALLRFPWPGFGVVGMLGLAGLLLLALQRLLGARLLPSAPLDGSAAWQVAILLALYLGSVVLTVTSDRIRLPLVPLLAPFAGLACVWTWNAARARSGRALGAALGALAIAGAVVHAPVFSAAELAEDLEKRDFNLAVQRIGEGRDPEARAILERLAEAHPRSARVRTLLAELDERTGGESGADRAIAALRAVLAAPGLGARERFRASAVLGRILLQRGEADAALAALADARAFDGDDPDLRLAHARALILAADAAVPSADSLSRLRAARELLLGLETERRSDPAASERIGLVLSQAAFALGRAQLDAGAVGGEKELARELVRGALKRLEPLGGSGAPEIRALARAQAGWIQLYLRNAPAAERHFRAALALAPESPDAELGLAQALVIELEAGTAAAAARAEAERILDRAAKPGAPVVLDLRKRLAAIAGE